MIFDKAKPLTAEHGEGHSGGGASHPNYPRVGRDTSLFFNLIAGRTPRSTPAAFWRSIGTLRAILRVTTLSMLLSGVLLLTVIVVDLRAAVVDMRLTQRLLEGGGILMVAGLVLIHATVFLYGFRFSIGRYQRFLKEHEWLVCMRCGYVLEHLPPKYRCPECGDAYDFEGLRLRWQEWADDNIANRAK